MWRPVLIVTMVAGLCTAGFAQSKAGKPRQAQRTPPVQAATPAPALEQAAVREVLSGDTLVLEGDRVVRLAGIDAPEPFSLGWADALNPARRPLGEQARKRLEELAGGQTIGLEPSAVYPARAGAVWAFVYLPDGRCVNRLLLGEGLAQVLPGTPEHSHRDEFEALQKQAMAARAGMWAVESADIQARLLGGKDTASRVKPAGGSGDQAGKAAAGDSLVRAAIIVIIVLLLGSGAVKIVSSVAFAKKRCPMCEAVIPKRDQSCSNCNYNFKTGYVGDAELQTWMAKNLRVIKTKKKK